MVTISDDPGQQDSSIIPVIPGESLESRHHDRFVASFFLSLAGLTYLGGILLQPAEVQARAARAVTHTAIMTATETIGPATTRIRVGRIHGHGRLGSCPFDSQRSMRAFNRD